jgi:hypothetical protein
MLLCLVITVGMGIGWGIYCLFFFLCFPLLSGDTFYNRWFKDFKYFLVYWGLTLSLSKSMCRYSPLLTGSRSDISGIFLSSNSPLRASVRSSFVTFHFDCLFLV